jgi:hypothetical protein
MDPRADGAALHRAVRGQLTAWAAGAKLSQTLQAMGQALLEARLAARHPNEELVKAAARIRAGRMPTFYQLAVSR